LSNNIFSEVQIFHVTYFFFDMLNCTRWQKITRYRITYCNADNAVHNKKHNTREKVFKCYLNNWKCFRFYVAYREWVKYQVTAFLKMLKKISSCSLNEWIFLTQSSIYLSEASIFLFYSVKIALQGVESGSYGTNSAFKMFERRLTNFLSKNRGQQFSRHLTFVCWDVICQANPKA
jgi:hypothetical protein